MKEIRSKINLYLEDSYSIRINNLEESIILTNKALALCEGKEFDDLKAKAYSQLSLYYMITGKYDESFNLSQKSIKLYEELHDDKGVADAKYNLASFYYKTNNFQMGVVYLIDALIVYKNLNDYHNISKCEKSLGTVYDFTGDEQKAIQSYKNAIKAAKKINDLNLESNAYNNLSGIYIKNNQVEAAWTIILKSIEIKQKTKDTRGLGFAIYGRGKIHFAQKNYTEAIADFIEAIAIHTEMGEKLGLGMAYTKLAKLYFEIEDIALAKKYASLGLEVCNSFNISIIKIKLLHLFYTIYKAENNLSKTLEFLEFYLFEKESVLNAQNFKVIENYDLLVRMQAMQKEAEFQKEKAIILAKSNKAEETARIRQEFLSTMSHEIRTPLNAITTVATMLNENAKPEDKVLVNSLKFSSNHLMQIVNNILDYTKLDLGKMTLDLKSSNIKFFLDNFWNAYNFQAKEKGIKFKLKLDEALFDYYYIDETKITQILGNLVNNSLKFTDIGAIKLDVKVVHQTETHDTVAFKVSDTGIGIEKENLEKVFESFSQLKSGITRKKDGAGLGLSITKRLIELHGSKIEIQSIIGKGSAFTFELKLKKSKNTEQNNQTNFENDINGVKVLLVEDNAINAMIALKLLSKWGMVTDHAKDGLEATEKSQNTKYDYILMDIHMPVLDGYQAAKNIRTLPNFNKETPIFGLTADIAAKDNEEYNFYFNDFLLKPLEIEKLKGALNSL
ncbi:ATP-binding protein [Flavobacterium sp. N1994]|uniref:tetratricopeptide repeat-containing hybrid sensor histidine kinase/response regulator n=1 Tax=Flavobacterium sp. N1994 TaxID=2986827 RepID=UPI002223437C|nr:ATP-binding protein [Flavobacterium sp. N1994]